MSRIQRILIILIIAFSAGCGGGTVGTDGGGTRSTQISGTVTTTANVPLVQAQIIDRESGNATFTDQSGRFEITSSAQDEAILMVSGESFESQVDIPLTGSEKVIVSLQADKEKQSLEVVTVSYSDVPAPVPTVVGSTPSPRSTPTSDQPQTSLFKGRLTDDSGRPISKAQVTVVEARRGDLTNARGEFEIKTQILSGTVHIRVTVAGTVVEAALHNVPNRPVVAELQLRLREPLKSNNVVPGTPAPPSLQISAQFR